MQSTPRKVKLQTLLCTRHFLFIKVNPTGTVRVHQLYSCSLTLLTQSSSLKYRFIYYYICLSAHFLRSPEACRRPCGWTFPPFHNIFWNTLFSSHVYRTRFTQRASNGLKWTSISAWLIHICMYVHLFLCLRWCPADSTFPPANTLRNLKPLRHKHSLVTLTTPSAPSAPQNLYNMAISVQISSAHCRNHRSHSCTQISMCTKHKVKNNTFGHAVLVK